MQEPVRLVFLHQNCLLRQLLVQAFSAEDQYAASDIDHVRPDHREQLLAIQPNVVLLDLSLPQKLAVELTGFVRQHFPDAKLIALVQGRRLSEHSEAALLTCVEAGAHGFVLEESSVQDLRDAIGTVLAGQRFFSQLIVESMFDQLAGFSREARWKSRMRNTLLTKRELEVLRWIAEGLSNKQIAKQLCVSLYTVKNHVHNILEKLQVPDRSTAVEYAIDNRWLRDGTGRSSQAQIGESWPTAEPIRAHRLSSAHASAAGRVTASARLARSPSLQW